VDKHRSMKISRPLIISFILILTAIFLAGCSGGTLATSWPGLLVDKNTGYLADNTFVYAVNLDNGSLKWKYPPDKGNNKISFFAPPVMTVDGTQLIVGGYDHVLYSLDPNNGTVLWTFPLTGGTGAKDRYIASPLVTAQGIFAPNADGYLYALDLKGNQLWPPFQTPQPLWAQPATDAKCQCLYIASMDHHMYAIDATSGSQIWKSPELGAAVVAAPTIGEDGTIFVGTFGKEMLALDSATGNIKWRLSTTDWVWSSAAQQDGSIFFGDLKGTFYSLTTSGKQNWSKQVDGLIVGTPLVADNLVFFATETGTVYATDYQGNPSWNTTVNGKIYSPVLTNGDTIYVTPSEGDALLVALTTTGTPKWSFVAPK